MPAHALFSSSDPIPLDHVTLPEALARLTLAVPDREVDPRLDQTRDLLRTIFGLPALGPDGGDHAAALPSDQSFTKWTKRELAIRLMRRGLGDHSLPARVFEPALQCLLRLEPADWRWAALVDQIIRGGIVDALPGESIGCHQGCRVLIAASDFERWLAQKPWISTQTRKPKRKECGDWLKAEMLASPERAPKLQSEYFLEARQKFNVSDRLFKTIWKEAREEAGAKWGPGRPLKSS
jgi:hypothetical protein